MINKIYKTINNKFSSFFKTFFFLRYLLLIFLISFTLFLIIPNFFDYKKKEEIIKSTLSKKYGIEATEIGKIRFNSLPVPHLKINDINFTQNSTKASFLTKELKIYPKLFSIYDFRNLKIKKIKFTNNQLLIDYRDVKNFANDIFNLSRKLSFNKSDITIKNSDNIILKLNDIKFNNYGYKKNQIEGRVFNENFVIKLKNNFSTINFLLKNTGVSAILNISERGLDPELIGNLKIKVLNSKLKLDFEYNQERIKIARSFFRNKNLSFDTNGIILIKPFFEMNLYSILKDIDMNMIDKIDLNSILDSKEIIKKINIRKILLLETKKFSRNPINNFKAEINLAYGRMVINKKFSISKTDFYCLSNINLIEEFPVINFKCQIKSPDKKDFLKNLNIKYKKKNEKFEVEAKGNINIVKNKVNFDSIETNNYQATEEDLRYFENLFETIILEKNIKDILKLKKIRQFVLEIS